MKKRIQSIVAPVMTAAIFAMTIGCGGAGDTGNLPSLYQGSWGGTWASGSGSDNGNVSLTVSADGSVSGTMTRKVGSGTVAGLIEKNGRISAVSSYAAGGNMVIGGSVQLTAGRLIGSFNYVQTGVSYAGTFDCGPATGSGSTGSTGG